jgi:glycerol-3-phosphate dehydrogenase
MLGFLWEGAHISGVKVRNHFNKEELWLEAPLVANLAGAWAPRIAQLAGIAVKVRPGKGVHIIFDRRLTNYAIVAEAIDSRQLFLEPHQNSTLLGTTDDDYYGDPDELWATEDEVGYLLEGMAQVFPTIHRYRMMRTMVGLRPTLHVYGPIEDKLTRDHAIYDHSSEGASGLYSMIGGKLAAYRVMSEEFCDLLCRKLEVNRPCTTHEVPLPGEASELSPAQIAEIFKLSPPAARRLFYRQGNRTARVLEHGAPSTFAICQCEPVLESEILYCIRHEGARTLDDLRRRTRLSMGPCQGYRCISRAAIILQKELGLDSSEVHAQMMDLLQERHRGKAPVLAGAGLAQEELNQAKYFLVGDFHRQLFDDKNGT